MTPESGKKPVHTGLQARAAGPLLAICESGLVYAGIPARSLIATVVICGNCDATAGDGAGQPIPTRSDQANGLAQNPLQPAD